MNETSRRDALSGNLATFGADLSRWPAEHAAAARESLLADPAFRAAWEKERDLDRALQQHASAIDGAIAASGSVERIRARALSRLPAPLAGLAWQRIAAAMLVAAMLGGMLDLVLAAAPGEAPDVVMLDPLEGLTEAELQ